MNKQVLFSRLISLSIGYLVLYSFNPFFVWDTHPLSLIFLLIYFAALFTAFFPIIVRPNLVRLRLIELTGILFFGAFTFYFRVFSDSLSPSALLSFFRLFLPIIVFAFLLRRHMEGAFNVVFNLFYISSIAVIGIWVIIFFGWGEAISFGVIEPVHAGKAEKGLFYPNYLIVSVLSNQISCGSIGCFSRASGFLDEPGFWGSICAFLIILKKGDLSKANVLTIFIGGLLTFSLAFYLIICLYFILTRPLFSLKVLFPIVVLSGMLLPQISSSEFFQSRVLNRLTIENGQFAGDNRSSEIFDAAVQKVMHDPVSALIGMGFQAHRDVDPSVSTYKVLLFNHGILGLTLLLGVLILMYLFGVSISGSFPSRHSVAFVAIFLLSIYQRPNVYEHYFIFLLIAAGALLGRKVPVDFHAVKKVEYKDKGAP